MTKSQYQHSNSNVRNKSKEGLLTQYVWRSNWFQAGYTVTSIVPGIWSELLCYLSLPDYAFEYFWLKFNPEPNIHSIHGIITRYACQWPLFKVQRVVFIFCFACLFILPKPFRTNFSKYHDDNHALKCDNITHKYAYFRTKLFYTALVDVFSSRPWTWPPSTSHIPPDK